MTHIDTHIIGEWSFETFLDAYDKLKADGWDRQEVVHHILYEATMVKKEELPDIIPKPTREDVLQEAKIDPKVIKLPPARKGNQLNG